jgi:hypothetical protein
VGIFVGFAVGSTRPPFPESALPSSEPFPDARPPPLLLPDDDSSLLSLPVLESSVSLLLEPDELSFLPDDDLFLLPLPLLESLCVLPPGDDFLLLSLPVVESLVSLLSFLESLSLLPLPTSELSLFPEVR